MNSSSLGTPFHLPERSPAYRETALYIVEALGVLVSATHDDAVENVLAASSNGWTPRPPIPNLALGIIRTLSGVIESVYHGPNAMGPSAASYFSETQTPPSHQTISEIRVRHTGDIETRDYIFPPVSGSLSNLPPFEPVADDPNALALIKARIDMIS